MDCLLDSEQHTFHRVDRYDQIAEQTQDLLLFRKGILVLLKRDSRNQQENLLTVCHQGRLSPKQPTLCVSEIRDGQNLTRELLRRGDKGQLTLHGTLQQ